MYIQIKFVFKRILLAAITIYAGAGCFHSAGSVFFLSKQVTNGTVYADISLTFGASADLPVTGDWISQGHDGVGTFRPGTSSMLLKNVLTSGGADNTFAYGTTGDIPVAGHWQVTGGVNLASAGEVSFVSTPRAPPAASTPAPVDSPTATVQPPIPAGQHSSAYQV